ncbi:MAG: DegT/DnrJ/EryC1/StrS aminotransferase family protein [Candidatus Aenigmarchaeota archaeon]|nr:DegT/DnrJ/EryC1/StrS aminotransferase family protein [Candidatus Aenigmarchaeota archaeon]
MKIPHSRPTINEEDINRVVSNLRSGLIAYGKEVEMFKHEISRYVGVLGGIATNSGTNALHLALKTLGIKHGDEVILPSYVCASVLSAVNYTGATPIFADIEDDGYNINHRSAAEKTTKNTKALIVPHMFGTPADLDGFSKLGLPIIEDCAQAIGAEYKGKKVGSFGDLSIFSFYATKVMTTGHGGMVLSNSPKMLEKLRDLTEYDEREKYDISYNYEMTDFQAALGRNQLNRLEAFIRQRCNIADIYDDAFKSIRQPARKNRDGICFRYIVDVEDADKYIEDMRKHEINCAKPVFKALHEYFDMDSKDFPNTERAMKRAVSIPIYPSLINDEINYICKIIKKI